MKAVVGPALPPGCPQGRGCADISAPCGSLRGAGVGLCGPARQAPRLSSRKEVIQPQVPLRLPCYDLVPVTELALGSTEPCRLRVLPAPMT